MCASKTIADERSVVQKESAALRASFREESGDANTRFAGTLDHRYREKLRFTQKEQCCEAAVSLYSWRTDSLRSNRMSQTASISALRRQEAGLFGDYAALR